jgi:hypothetical protein
MRIGSYIMCSMITASMGAMSFAEPAVELPSFADNRVLELDHFSSTLPLPVADDPDAELVYDSMQTLSLVATSLLVRGDRGGADSSHATITGAELADGLDHIQRMLQRLGDGSIPRADRAAARHALRLFQREARQRLGTLAVPDPDRLDELLHDLLGPLVQAVRRLGGTTPPSGWWPVTGTPGLAMNPLVLEELMTRASAADWLGDRDRARLSERLIAIGERDASSRRMKALLHVVVAIDAVRGLPGGRGIADRLGNRFMEVVEFDPGGLPPEAALTEVARVIERMHAYRSGEMPRELSLPSRRLYASLSRQYEEGERAMLQQILPMLESKSPRSDPALVASIHGQSEPLEMLALLARSPRWHEQVRRVHPPSAEGWSRQVAVLQRDLGDLQKREEAIDALEVMGTVIDGMHTMPLESKLGDPDGLRSRLLAGTEVDLAESIMATRVAWVQEASAGRPDGLFVSRMSLQRRLLSAVERTSVLMEVDDEIDVLNDWSGWYTPPGVLRAWQERLVVRLRIAATALRESEPSVVSAQLDRAEQDLEVLELLALLRRRPASMPEGDAGMLLVGRLARSPGEDAWMLEHRVDLAIMSRTILELGAARRTGFVEEADAMERDAAYHARRLRGRLPPG